MCIVRYLIPTCLRHTPMAIDNNEKKKNDDNNYYDDCCITNDDDDDILHCNSRCNIEAHPVTH